MNLAYAGTKSFDSKSSEDSKTRIGKRGNESCFLSVKERANTPAT